MEMGVDSGSEADDKAKDTERSQKRMASLQAEVLPVTYHPTHAHLCL